MVTYTVRATGPLFTDPNLAARVDPHIVGMLADVGAYAQRLAVDRTPAGVSAGGGLRGSIFSEPRGTPVARSQYVSSSLFYAPIQEVGRRPGRRPPAGALLLWVTRKLLIGPGWGPLNPLGVAFLVARKIGRVGTRGHHMFEQAFQKSSPYFHRQAEQLAGRIAREAGGS
jgi:hypothetical protein